MTAEPRTEVERVALDELLVALEYRIRKSSHGEVTLDEDTANGLLAALQQARPEPSGEAVALLITESWQDLCDLTDRTSPEEYPDMCLITVEELAHFMERGYSAPFDPAPAQPNDAVPASGVWELFQDEGYFGMWCVRQNGSTRFGEGFHVVSREEAQALVAALSTAPASPSPAEAAQPSGHVEIKHDGFAGDIIGHYTTREGRRRTDAVKSAAAVEKDGRQQSLI